LNDLDTRGRPGDVLEASGAEVLEGAAGVALALLSLADPVSCGWERMLLLG
jgi:hypothetical protein